MSILTSESKFDLSPAHIYEHYHCEMTLKDRIKKARLDAKLNKSELARACGVNPSAINKLESGDTKSISGDLLLKISLACRCDPYDIGGMIAPPFINGTATRVEDDPAKAIMALAECRKG